MIADKPEWRRIPFAPQYEVSDFGDVRRNGRVLLADSDHRGRRRHTLCVNGITKKHRTPRLVLTVFVGPCPDGMECCHNNGDETDDSLSNLRWDTHSSNLMDRRQHGTAVNGEQVHTSKLTRSDVLEIRRMRARGLFLRDIARRFSVTETMISLIARRRNWQHV